MTVIFVQRSVLKLNGLFLREIFSYIRLFCLKWTFLTLKNGHVIPKFWVLVNFIGRDIILLWTLIVNTVTVKITSQRKFRVLRSNLAKI